MSREIKFRIIFEKDPNIWLKEDGYTIRDLIEMDGAGFLGDDDIIEQCTGLKDKNGKEIYEGDIVKFGDSIATIIWRDKHAEFGVRWTDCGIEDSLDWQVGTEKTSGKVIGNIHENPELLGGKE